MGFRGTAIILLICTVGCILAQYSDDGEEGSRSQPRLTKKPLIPRRQLKTSQSARLTNTPSPPSTNVIAQRFRRPVPLSKPRPSTSEPPPGQQNLLPVFTSGIIGSRASSAPVQSYEQNDEPSSAIPIQTIQQPAVVYAQSAPSSPQPPEYRPVNEVQEKDEDVVQVIANLGAVSSYQNNLLTPTVAPTATPISPTIGAYLAQQHERQRQDDRLRQDERLRQEEHLERQRQEEKLDRLERQRQEDRQRQKERVNRQRQEQQQRLQDERLRPEHQVIQPVQYRGVVPLSISRNTPLQSFSPENQAIHQVIAPVQYKPQKPIRLPKKQQQQPQQQVQQTIQRQDQQQILDRNEYDYNERPVVKQRAQVVPKKSKPQGDYYEGRTKKPVAQVIRRYREETADGSIIWGFENDDGSFKEEIIGIDCITRGKYGYVDPDGVRREYTYETGIKCDEEATRQQDQDILNTFVDYQENKLVLPSGKTIDLSSMGKKQARRPQPLYRN